MSQYQKERMGNSMGDPSRLEKTKGKKSDPFFSGSAKKGVIAKGLNAHDPDSLPSAAGAGKGFKNQTDSEIRKGSI